MKQSIGNWDADEISVAEILIQLPELIPAHDFTRPSFSWGVKRRRSAMPQPQQPLPVAGEIPTAKSNAATSPATPLMFSPSESDEKSKTQSPVFASKRKGVDLQNKEELMQSFADLTHQKNSLVKEMEAVKRHLETLRASNLELKNRKQIMYGLSPSSRQTLHQHNYPHPHLHQQQPFRCSAIQWNSRSSSFTESSLAIGTGIKTGLPDLNLRLDEPSDAVMMAMDYNANRALASAQARKRRMQIYKEKNQNQILRQR